LTKAFRLFAPWIGPRDATGALRRGGRWNSPGKAVLYAASSLSLACLEILVHLRHVENLPEYSYAEVHIPDDQVEAWNKPDKRTRAVLESAVLSREIGDNWIRDRGFAPLMATSRLPVLQVPSAVIPQEWNFIIDPESADLQWHDPKPFRVDPRLVDPALR
jgi:RES domain-containing protein